MPRDHGHHVAFLDGVTGYLGRWTLFWFLEELPNERIAVLIRPSKKGRDCQENVEQRLDQVLGSIGMRSERHRITAIPGDLAEPGLGNPEELLELRADCWLHIAGDVTFKKLGDRGALAVNRDYTANFLETARRARATPRVVCHTSTFYVFERSGSPDQRFEVPEEFHDPARMEHHNAYGYSKLEAERVIQGYVEQRALPFPVLIFRPDIVMHHIPVPAVAVLNPGLITDDFKVVYQLLAALIGRVKIKIPGGPTVDAPLPYLPVSAETILYTSDADSIARAMMQLAVLHSDGSAAPERGYRIFQLVNRWRPVSCDFLSALCTAVAPASAARVQQLTPAQFQATVLPGLSWLERTYYTRFIEPFVGYMHRPRTEAATGNVDALLGDDWHNLHPAHGVDLRAWLLAGAQQALERDFGQA